MPEPSYSRADLLAAARVVRSHARFLDHKPPGAAGKNHPARANRLRALADRLDGGSVTNGSMQATT